MASLFTIGTYAQAENNISYNYLELGYDYLDLSGENAKGLYLNGSFELNDLFYMGGYYDHDEVGRLDFDQYGLFLGLRKSISQKTDFYSELSLGRVEVHNIDSTIYGLDIGTRTAFTEKFELITKLGYVYNNRFNEDFIEVGVKGLFKFGESSAVSLGIENIDTNNFGVNVGYRYSF
ncbi:MAG: hypothetical protein JKX98_08725 [Alcanivoracaceae bacterium]|nr:hypothetical protein [Alcanivoracaceae bacterium]